MTSSFLWSLHFLARFAVGLVTVPCLRQCCCCCRCFFFRHCRRCRLRYSLHGDSEDGGRSRCSDSPITSTPLPSRLFLHVVVVVVVVVVNVLVDFLLLLLLLLRCLSPDVILCG